MELETSEKDLDELLEGFEEKELVDEVNVATQEQRYEIIDYLIEQKRGQAPLSEIADNLERHSSTVIGHLEELSDIDVVEQPEEGAMYEITDYGINLFYRVNP